MRSDWLEISEELLRPLVVEGVIQGGHVADYLESGKVQEALAKMNREDLEVIAMAAVMYGIAGTRDVLQMKQQ